MSTAVTVRNMLSIVDAFAKTKDGKRAAKFCNLLNYYETSYGSFLGQTFAFMFPNRVGNFVIDGIVSPAGYLNNFSDSAILHLDGVFTAYFSYAQLDAKKAQKGNWANATEIETALLNFKIAILGAAYTPLTQFANMTEGLLALEHIIKELEGQSIIGEVWLKSELGCSGWSIKNKYIFQGPFRGKNKKPIVLVSNTYDPVTPIENAISGTQKYWNAQRVTVEGTVHTSQVSPNTCLFAKLRAYFQADVLPGTDAYCLLEQQPFGVSLKGTIEELIEKAG
ncbi:MAG: hypothetical protein MMC23_002040 [Stictis urceolatum]|nr:hypothetical protein [Stictis urceolata]